ncbi:MAG: SET domain-containing protein [Saprospiraceae bacterium]|nr:SET domain-containing protein [Saprospiraceae bacterium]
MDANSLLNELAANHWVGLRPSPLHGVGVFALCEIPCGCTGMFSKDPGEWVHLSYADVDELPGHARKLVEAYCLFDESGYFVPAGGFKAMDLSLFLNHSETPNIASIDDGAAFVALRDISAGEELLVDYGSIVNSDE